MANPGQLPIADAAEVPLPILIGTPIGSPRSRSGHSSHNLLQLETRTNASFERHLKFTQDLFVRSHLAHLRREKVRKWAFIYRSSGGLTVFTCWAFKLVYVCSSKILKIHQVHDAKVQHRKATAKMAEKTPTKKELPTQRSRNKLHKSLHSARLCKK